MESPRPARTTFPHRHFIIGSQRNILFVEEMFWLNDWNLHLLKCIQYWIASKVPFEAIQFQPLSFSAFSNIFSSLELFSISLENFIIDNVRSFSNILLTTIILKRSAQDCWLPTITRSDQPHLYLGVRCDRVTGVKVILIVIFNHLKLWPVRKNHNYTDTVTHKDYLTRSQHLWSQLWPANYTTRAKCQSVQKIKNGLKKNNLSVCGLE